MRVRMEMVVSSNTKFTLKHLSSCCSSLPIVTKNRRKSSFTTLAKRTDLPPQNSNRRINFPLKIVAQSAIAVFALGFIDAGYSGDWSRIGVISKESEELLKVGAFIVVPLCLFLILNLSRKQEKLNQ